MKKITLLLAISSSMFAGAYERFECDSAPVAMDLRESGVVVIEAPASVNIEYGTDFLFETNGEAQVKVNGVKWVAGGARCNVDFVSDICGTVVLTMGRFQDEIPIGVTHNAYLEVWSCKAKVARADLPLVNQMP